MRQFNVTVVENHVENNAQDDSQSQVTIREKYEDFRTLFNRESDLLNNRMTWLLTSQTILFLAFSNFFKTLKEGGSPFPALIITVTGLLINVSFKSVLDLGDEATEYYKEKLKESLKNTDYLPLVYEREQTGSPWFPWKILPWLFGIAWILLFCMISFGILNQGIALEEHFAKYFCPS
ncbi:MAG: hypothetical protein F6K30_14850 [Cyanothece sp. SIO2G6]|nr:hypothetical protein [Cyanothece sp. SIO2G6]